MRYEASEVAPRLQWNSVFATRLAGTRAPTILTGFFLPILSATQRGYI